MDQEKPTVIYRKLFLKPDKERVRIFGEITAANSACLVRTHPERWLAANRLRLSDEQIATVERLVRSISPELNGTDRDLESHPDAEALIGKVQALLPREDVRQLATHRADHIPAVEDEDD